MRVLITGATGFIGRALVPRLQRDGHTVIAWTRSAARARSLLGSDVETLSSDAADADLASAISACDAVVNLAGEPILGGRWTTARRAALASSRVGVTDRLVAALESASRRPRVFVSGSAVGFYGDRGAERLSESSSAGDDFLADLCQRWERAARAAERSGARVVLLRTGVVLGRAGGALAQMLPPFSVGLGGPIGSGRQYMPWIHLHDLVRIIATALVDERLVGPVNGVAPEPATNAVFTRALGRALHRPAVVPVPAIALKVIFGEASTVLLASQRVEPRALLDAGFTFEYPVLSAALDAVVGSGGVTITGASSQPDAAGKARYELRARTVIDAPLAETFGFFSKPENLGLITPAGMQFVIEGPVPSMGAGAAIDYRLRVGPMPVTWRSRIARWEPGAAFVDVQERGPYRYWWHEHAFRAEGSRTVMEDRVFYAPPLGVLGRIVNRWLIAPTLRSIFEYRSDVIRLRFGTVHPTA